MTTLAVLQPGYLPWLGFFDQMQRVDIFVYYDDVQFDKHGWRNRNRIKSPVGPQWLTVPVLSTGYHGQSILDTEIDGSKFWSKKHLNAIRQNYARAPYLKTYLPEIESTLNFCWRYLVDLDLALIEMMCHWLDIQTPTARSSTLGITGDRSMRLLELCRHFGANIYLSGDAAQDYLEVELFADHGVTVEWQRYQHPTYAQIHGDFVPYLSALDLVLNNGSASQHIIRRKH